MAIITLRPNSDSSYYPDVNGEYWSTEDGTTSGSTNFYSFIDESTVSYTDYIQFNQGPGGMSSPYFIFGLDNSLLSDNIKIKTVTVKMDFQHNPGGEKSVFNGDYYFFMQNSTGLFLSDPGYEYSELTSKSYDVNPVDGEDWEKSDLDQIKFICNVTNNTGVTIPFFIYQLYVEVTTIIQTNKIIGKGFYTLDKILSIGVTAVSYILRYELDLTAPPKLIVSGRYNSIHSDGFSWGIAAFGALGNNQLTPNYSTPIIVCGNHIFCQISTGNYTSGIIDNNGQAWTWGLCSYGLLGDNTKTCRSTPVAVCGNHTFCQISLMNSVFIALDNNGNAWTWGQNSYGQLGINSLVCKSTPVLVCGNHTFCQISTGKYHCVGIDNNGQAWAWGSNGNGDYGRLGDNTILSRRTPVAVCGNHTFCQISAGEDHTLAIDVNGQAWAWGFNNYGQLGNNNRTPKSTPVSIYGSYEFCQISAGYEGHSIALDSSNQAWTWGQNSNGQLGDNTTTCRSKPVAVCGNHTFCHISAGWYACVGITTDGRSWAWGQNSNGKLGDNTNILRSTPVAVCI